MLVRVLGEADLAVAEDLHDDSSVHALLEQQRCRGVTGVVQPAVANAGFLRRDFHSFQSLRVPSGLPVRSVKTSLQ
jgi:hypothetical protein